MNNVLSHVYCVKPGERILSVVLYILSRSILKILPGSTNFEILKKTQTKPFYMCFWLNKECP